MNFSESTKMKQTLVGGLTAACALMLHAPAALAHEGHGLPGSSHWHAGDVLLFVGVVAVAAVAWMASRRK